MEANCGRAYYATMLPDLMWSPICTAGSRGGVITSVRGLSDAG